MLMPSLVWPLVFGPKPAMMRPFAGHRNDRLLLPARTELVAGGASGGVAALAVSAGWGLASAGAAFGSAAALGSGLAFGGALSALGCVTIFCSCARAIARFAGIVMRSPIFTLVCAGMLLRRASSVGGILYLRAIAYSVSPGATTCTTGCVGAILPAGAFDWRMGGGSACGDCAGGGGACTEPVVIGSGAWAG